MNKKMIFLPMSALLCAAGLGGCTPFAETENDTAKMAAIRNALEKITDTDNVVFFGDAAPSQEAVMQVEKQIAALTADGHDLSFIMVDIGKRSGAMYCADRIMCTQSTIKALYVGALLEEQPDLFEKHQPEIQKIIELSDNEAYMWLRETYGDEPLGKWCAECDVDRGFLEKMFPRRTVRNMIKLWTKMTLYLNSDKTPTELKNYFQNSACSSAKEVLSGRAKRVQSKAGWENGLPEGTLYSTDLVYPEAFTDKDPYNDECAINDTGMIETKDGTYIFAIVTDWPYGQYPNMTPENPLNGMTEALYTLHQSFYNTQGK